MTATQLNATPSEADLEDILAPNGGAWNDIDSKTVELAPTPLDRQPSAYVQVAWKDRGHGKISELTVQAITHKDTLALRIQWAADQPKRSINDINAYADACAVSFSAGGDEAELQTMGSPGKPVVAWHWRAGTEAPFSVTASGIGTAERSADHQLQAHSRWSDEHWQVVFAGPLDSLSFSGADGIPIAFAIWCGANSERAGLKAHSPGSCQLTIK